MTKENENENEREPLWLDLLGLIVAVMIGAAALWVLPYFVAMMPTVHTHQVKTLPHKTPGPNKLAQDFDKGLVEGAVIMYLLNSK